MQLTMSWIFHIHILISTQASKREKNTLTIIHFLFFEELTIIHKILEVKRKIKK
jgi:hypothetical protein